MSKLKNLISKISIDLRDLVKKFPLTMGIIIFLTLLGAVIYDQDFSRATEEILEKIYLFSSIWAVGTFFSETFFLQNKRRFVSYGVTGIISFVYKQLAWAENMSDETSYLIVRTLIAYISLLIILTVYKTIKNSGLKFEEYILKVFRDFLHTGVTYIILNIGVVSLIAIFVELILDGEYGNSIFRSLILLFGLYYVTSWIRIISDTSKKEVNSFIKGLVLYVLFPLTTIAIAIIYMYIAKIIILRDIPQNMVFRILAGVFIVAFPVWNMASNFSQEKKLIGKTANILPYSYIPLILLEIYAMGIRISEFGLTDTRYCACIFILIQMLALFLTFYKNKEKILNLFIYSSVIISIVCLTPLNPDNVSSWSQKNIMKSIMPENVRFSELTDEEKSKVKGAYQYLRRTINGKEYISTVSAEEKEQIITFNIKEEREYTTYFSVDKKLENFNIEKYKKITEFYDYVDESAIIKLEDLDKTIDIEKYIKNIMEDCEISESYAKEKFEQNNVVEISDTEDMYISKLTIDFYESSKKIEYLRIEGYLLEK